MNGFDTPQFIYQSSLSEELEKGKGVLLFPARETVAVEDCQESGQTDA